MKKVWLMLAVLVGLVSCDQEEIYKAPDVNNIYPLETQRVEVPEGYVAVVRLYEDTLAVLTQTADIMVPKSKALTKSFAEAITIEYLENNNTMLTNRYQTFQVVAFEDSEFGDYDYNDLIVHIKIYQTTNTTKFFVQPVALGSIKTIKFGVRIGDQDVILAENCRRDLFDGMEGFINTELEGVKHKFWDTKNFTKDIPCTYGKDINWFIEVDNGQRLYAVSKTYPSLNTEGMAYGLIFTNINEPYYYKGDACGLDWFNYPLETVHIKTVYPEFQNLMRGSTVSFKQIFSTPAEKYFPAIQVDANRVATEECLYAITFPN